MDSLTDTVSLSFLRELVDWAEVDPLLTRLADVRKVTRRRRSALCSQEFVAASSWDTCCEPSRSSMPTAVADVSRRPPGIFLYQVFSFMQPRDWPLRHIQSLRNSQLRKRIHGAVQLQVAQTQESVAFGTYVSMC